MSVIADVEFAPQAFELGRIFETDADLHLEIERVVPLGETIIPFVWVYDGGISGFVDRVQNHPSVEKFEIRESHDNRNLYAFEWESSRDLVLEGIQSVDGSLLEGTGTADRWRFEIRFPDHEALTAFQEFCIDANIEFEVVRIYNPTKPEAGPWYGLTQPQREALVLATEEGYFDIPRQISTKELGRQLGISDQAVTERLRRGMSRLMAHTLMVTNEEQRP